MVSAGADWIHVDVTDGRFVPNITIGPAVLQAIRRSTTKPLNVHLICAEHDLHPVIEVDGGENGATAAQAAAAGATAIVAGSAIFGTNDYAAAIAAIRASAIAAAARP